MQISGRFNVILINIIIFLTTVISHIAFQIGLYIVITLSAYLLAMAVLTFAQGLFKDRFAQLLFLYFTFVFFLKILN